MIKYDIDNDVMEFRDGCL